MHYETLRKYNDLQRRLISQAEERAYRLSTLGGLDSEEEINEWLAIEWPKFTSDTPCPWIKEDGEWIGA